MKVFILTAKGFETELFNSLNEVIERLNHFSIVYNDTYSLFGRPYDLDDEGKVIHGKWVCDSAVFSIGNEYKTYYIERIDTEKMCVIDFEE
jgi:hypothetical protein